MGWARYLQFPQFGQRLPFALQFQCGTEHPPGFAQVSLEQMRATRHILDGTGSPGNGSNYGNVEGITECRF